MVMNHVTVSMMILEQYQEQRHQRNYNYHHCNKGIIVDSVVPKRKSSRVSMSSRNNHGSSVPKRNNNIVLE